MPETQDTIEIETSFETSFEDGLHARLSQRKAHDGREIEAPVDGADEEADLLLMQRALESYRAESMRWADERSAKMPVPQMPARAPWLSVPRWALAAAALACMTGGALYVQHGGQPAAVAVHAPSEQMLAEDDRLLHTVDAVLDRADMPTEQELGLTQADAGTTAGERAGHHVN